MIVSSARPHPLHAGLAAALVAFSGAACGPGQHTGRGPDLALAASAEAQARFRALRSEWVSAPPDARVRLERPLVDFVQRYPTDPQGRWVRLYLAWLSVQRGRLEEAERWLELADPGSAGAASDLSGVVRAAIALARGRASAAYDDLLSLSGRLIDADDRLLCLDQLVLAALADGRHRAAVQHVLELAAQAARRHRERMWRRLEPRLASIPLSELEASLPSVTPDRVQSPAVQPAERAAAVDWLRRTVLERLSRSAIDQQNVALAQRLVSAPRSERGAEVDKSELLMLATRGTQERTVSGRTLGLALDLSDATRSQRSIDVATGIALTLDLASPPPSPAPLVLSTRQVEDGDTGDALGRLLGDGASLLVAGFDRSSAAAAAEFASSTGAPVLLLHDPGGDGELPPSAYVLGADEQQPNDLLFAALVERFQDVIRVGEPGAPCPSSDGEIEALLARASAGPERPKLQFDAGPGCTRSVLMRVPDELRPQALGFGLDALGAAWDGPNADEIWAVGAGRLPSFVGADALAKRWHESKGRAPTWYEGLGHDAALIAAAVIGPAPDRPVREPAEIQIIYRELSQRLSSSLPGELWTSDGGRFDAGRRMPREFRAERLQRPGEAAR